MLVTIGVHSPKFEHEKDAAALAAAVERYGVDHPVLDDPEMDMWQQYAAKAWPTLTVIDPEGYVVATMAGEGHAEGLARLVEELVRVHDARGTLRRGDAPHLAPRAADETWLMPDSNARIWLHATPVLMTIVAATTTATVRNRRAGISPGYLGRGRRAGS